MRESSFRLRNFISLFLGFSGLAIVISGAAIFVSPPGRVAHWVHWTLLGLSKEQWQAMHTVLSILFAALSIWHLVYNWKLFIRYITAATSAIYKWKRESVSALLLTILLVIMSVFSIPPVSWIMTGSEAASNAWEVPGSGPIVPHAEQMTLEAYSLAADIPMKRILNRLRLNGYTAQPTDTLEQIAARLNCSPMDLAELFGRPPGILDHSLKRTN